MKRIPMMQIAVHAECLTLIFESEHWVTHIVGLFFKFGRKGDEPNVASQIVILRAHDFHYGKKSLI